MSNVQDRMKDLQETLKKLPQHMRVRRAQVSNELKRLEKWLEMNQGKKK